MWLFVKNISKEQQVASNGNKKATLTLVPGEGSSLYLEEILKQKTFTRLSFLDQFLFPSYLQLYCCLWFYWVNF